MPLLSMRLLHTFSVVAEELHFGRAAERLHMTQPPLSQQIRQLEQLIGAELFHRTTRSVSLTPAGRILHDRAKKILQDAEAAADAARRAASGSAGSVAVGFTASSIYRTLPRLVSAFRRQYPEVELRLEEMRPEPMLDALHADKLDVALLRPPEKSLADPRLAHSVIARERLVLALPADHALAHLEQVPVSNLDGLHLIGFSPDQAPYSYELCQRLFHAAQVVPHVVQASILPTMLALVEAGMGAALVPASAQATWSGALHYRPLADTQENITTLYAVRRQDMRNPAAEKFVDLAAMQGGVPREP
ncbi:LysR family transcriptional regulator [Pigmentiphaga sp. GD03639]|uniref:LysR family transcriptional regulator n=1 Tax=unclassified Pigmentiphaga TaxID=2626614 RepID=UPI00159577E5|nr:MULTISPECIES: LysR family transcriptional regulator [unclassified Pigmentiphaga]MDH2238974.1 LysR family transcriptional regulator [Pigmentiphaga sp. GD03639]